LCPDQVPWSIRVKRSWETLSNASAMAEQVVMLVKYSKAMRYIHSGSGIESHLPSESLCLFLCGLPVTRILCCNNKFAPSLGHCICCFLQNRLLTTSFTVDSINPVAFGSPLRYLSP